MPKGRSSLLPFNYMLWIFRLIPFAVPPLMGLQEEICGRIMWLNYAMLTLFLASLITLYVWELYRRSPVGSKGLYGMNYSCFMLCEYRYL